MDRELLESVGAILTLFLTANFTNVGKKPVKWLKKLTVNVRCFYVFPLAPMLYYLLSLLESTDALWEIFTHLCSLCNQSSLLGNSEEK